MGRPSTTFYRLCTKSCGDKPPVTCNAKPPVMRCSRRRSQVQWRNRAHFFGVAAQLMRRWITGWTLHPGNDASAWQAFPVDGGSPVVIGGTTEWNWSPDGASVSVSEAPVSEGRSYLVPLAAGTVLPRIPPEGFRTEQEVAKLPGAHKFDVRMVLGPSIDIYALYRSTTQRNLYRIPIP